MVKHTQTKTIRWLLPTNCLSVFDHFLGLAFKGLKISFLMKHRLPTYNFLTLSISAIIYLFNKNTKKKCEICSELTIKTPKRRQRRRFGVFIVKFEHISHLFLVLLLLTLNK